MGDLICFPGKACGVPRDGNPDKKEETELLWTNVVESQSAFLGPNLWDNKTIPYDNDLKVIILSILSSINTYIVYIPRPNSSPVVTVAKRL